MVVASMFLFLIGGAGLGMVAIFQDGVSTAYEFGVAIVTTIFSGAMIWLFGIFFWGPALVVAWPIANVALRRGFAGWGTACGAGALIIGVGSVVLSFPSPLSLVEFATVAGIGAIFAGLYWRGAYTSDPERFRIRR